MYKVYIDGQVGTTGLQLRQKLQNHKEVEILLISEELRKDENERKRLMNEADVVFLCLPDDAAKEAVKLVENPNTCVIDASTAHRVNPDWTYGFPELSPAHREKIKNSKRIANPGCHATGFIAAEYPLVEMGIIPRWSLMIINPIVFSMAAAMVYIVVCPIQKKSFKKVFV